MKRKILVEDRQYVKERNKYLLTDWILGVRGKAVRHDSKILNLSN